MKALVGLLSGMPALYEMNSGEIWYLWFVGLWVLISPRFSEDSEPLSTSNAIGN